MSDNTDVQTVNYRLRPAQADILGYEQGRMAVSAVPGSGKTFILSLLTAQLIASGRINPTNQQILIVTYLNSSVDTFKARVRQRLQEMNLPLVGFEVRTLHSLGREIMQLATGDEPAVIDESQSNNFLAKAIDAWKESQPDLWQAFLPDNNLQMQTRWRGIVEQMSKTYIRTAKNERLRPEQIQDQLHQAAPNTYPLLWLLNAIYSRYQTILTRQGAFDFDDLIWQAVELLETRPDIAQTFNQRWPYILEDEAQDSVPLQEALLNALTAPIGNWVRVGDPNQAITSTFTAAHPRYFNAFIDRPDVLAKPLPNSGRCAPLILNAANTILNWVCDKHPVLEVRHNTFRRQDILPVPDGDSQPNPPNSEAQIRIKVYKHREDEELPAVVKQAITYANQHPDQTLAILVPTNNIGYSVAELLDEQNAAYDSLLRGGTREREIAAAIHALLALLAEPTDTRLLAEAHAALVTLEHPSAGFAPRAPQLERFGVILRSVHRPESLLFPWQAADVLAALPAGVATEEDLAHLQTFLAFLRHIFALRPLPIDDLALALADELFASPTPNSHHRSEADLATAYQLAGILRNWRDFNPDWRLPELVSQLADVATGRRSLPLSGPSDFGFEPEPGRITLATQHSAKGLEWDTVFLVGIDGYWIPGSLEAPFQGVYDFLGGDPIAEATAQLRHLMYGDAGLYPGRTATDSAHIEIISERLRLLYVGLTRAKRNLFLSRSRATRQFNKEREAEPATVLAILHQYLSKWQVASDK